ncbi:hypothetical protein [Geodermatophilus sp. URMC 62]|uniref:hypothetical protein n=1 Tax=Geodermatophilus sp. URMC 62 TaxID=3423414 RepID=UPI00406C6DEF
MVAGLMAMSGLLLLVLLVFVFAHRLSASRIRFRASATKWFTVEIEVDRLSDVLPEITGSD